MGLKDRLRGVLPEDVLSRISNHYEIIGDIAVLSLPPDLGQYKETIAHAVVNGHKNIYTVLNKTGAVGGADRTARYERVYGNVMVTVHHEFGFSYRLDVSRSFFSTRMAHERRRVTEQVEPGERVYVPFAGVGPFAIPAAARGAEVYAVEHNPDALAFFFENIRKNHVSRTCHARMGDALDIALLIKQPFDRLIIPAPYGMDTALVTLLPLLSEGGMAHFYTFCPKEEIPDRIAAYESMGLTVTYYTSCGNVAPGISRWAFDLALPLHP